MILQIQKDGHSIASIDDWFQFAPPKEGRKQWVDGRSAKELAKIFLESGKPLVPPEIQALLSSHPELGTVSFSSAISEHQIRLDRFRGEPRNADLAGIGCSPQGTVAVTIEAKADESFAE